MECYLDTIEKLSKQIACLKQDLKNETERCLFFEEELNLANNETKKFRDLLAESHALVGRLVHEASSRWDSVAITPYFSSTSNYTVCRHKKETEKIKERFKKTF
jgi:hypothetical protein